MDNTISVDMDEDGIADISSVCMNCHEQGMTRFLLTDIPYFRQIVVCSFSCPHCEYRNNEVMPAGSIADKGVQYRLDISTGKREDKVCDLNRQIIKSNFADISIPQLDFCIPAGTQKGQINTIEGFLSTAAEQLQLLQPQRMMADPETARKIQDIIDQLVEMSQGNTAFTLVLEDPSGNSFIENPYAPQKDPRLVVKTFDRSDTQTEALGYAVEEIKQKKGSKLDKSMLSNLETHFDVTSQAAVIPGVCESCHQPSETRMCVTYIPFFKEVVIMVTQCDLCGFKDAEVKPGGGIEPLGTRITLRVTSPEDLKRDLLKSDSASICIPELELELGPGTLGGKYTTLEGILGDILDQLKNSNPFQMGDSGDAEEKEGNEDVVTGKAKFTAWLSRLEELSRCENEFTFILDDPMGNAFVYNPKAPEEDPNMTTEHYERTDEQNEDLGINDMKTENY